MAKDLGMIAFGKVKQLEKRVKELEERIKAQNTEAEEQVRNENFLTPEIG